MPHPPLTYHSQQGLLDAMVGFADLARTHGLNVGVGETLEAVRAAEIGMIEREDSLRYALKSIFCCAEEEGETFDRIFDQYWCKNPPTARGKTTFYNQSNRTKDPKGSVVMMGRGEVEQEVQESKNISGANAVERLVKTDFAHVSQIDHAWLEELAWKLWKQMSMRLKRRQKQAQRGTLNLRITIRKSLNTGGVPVKLHFNNKVYRKQRLVILLDVSGSMDKYSFFLLRFICALKTHFEQVEAFLFSTRLVRISEMLEPRLLDATLDQLSKEADHWSSGTRIGECFRTFNQQYAKRILNGKSTVLIVSDGLDTGEPEVLAKETAKIHLRTRQLIWLNPLKGMEGYQPIARGMKAALPSVDVFRSAHNLQSILELEKFLLHV